MNWSYARKIIKVCAGQVNVDKHSRERLQGAGTMLLLKPFATKTRIFKKEK